MEKISKFIECLIPVTACNLKCEYCYIIQEDRRSDKMPNMRYTAEEIGRALTKKRLGGICYISICGAGETLLPKETIEIIYELLKNGHYVNVTTNGTISKRFNEISKFPKEFLERLHFAFSLHYLELKKNGLLDVFSENVLFAKEMGCSFVVQLNLYDGYIPYVNEIKEFCIERFGAYPQIAATREECGDNIKLHTCLSKEEYKKIGADFNSPLFDFTMMNFNVKRREYCYAGDWSFILDLDTGIMRRCYNVPNGVNIFENPEKDIKFEAIGRGCRKPFCVNSSHFISLGIIPELETSSYSELRNRKEANWYSPRMMQFLSQKLYDNNNQYNIFKKIRISVKDQIKRKLSYFKYHSFKIR